MVVAALGRAEVFPTRTGRLAIAARDAVERDPAVAGPYSLRPSGNRTSLSRIWSIAFERSTCSSAQVSSHGPAARASSKIRSARAPAKVSPARASSKISSARVSSGVLRPAAALVVLAGVVLSSGSGCRHHGDHGDRHSRHSMAASLAQGRVETGTIDISRTHS
jgi:hypothetical protein